MSLHIRSRIVGAFFLVFFAVLATRAADFGVRVPYQKNTPVPFAAFTLTYLGERHVVTPKFPPGMTVYDFKLTSPQGTQTLSWSSGTGDIGPTIFRVGGAQYGLELKRSDKLGRLKDNELVVSRAP